ncbi:hypothetical protein BDZ97DRAFT_2079594 [Flammula alnicola]|nr:hypothetical protein BDZ97DRAFT_2079594 [Flammula alnicola]
MAAIGDGVSEGIGRLRREIHKARSPKLIDRSDISLSALPFRLGSTRKTKISSTAMHLKFRQMALAQRAESASSLVTPSNSSTRHLMDADVMGSMEEEIWNGWDPQEKLAVEEAEQFHDIAAVGYLDGDREQQPVIVPSDVTKRKGRPKRWG